MAELRIIFEGSEGAAFPLGGDQVLIGRAPPADIVLVDPCVSTAHAILHRRGTGWLLRDLGSTNGTRVNGVPVREALLAPGDEVVLGKTLLVYRGDPAGVSAPTDAGSELPDTRRLDVAVLVGHLLEPKTDASCDRPSERDPRFPLLCRMMTQLTSLAAPPEICRKVLAIAREAGAERAALEVGGEIFGPADLLEPHRHVDEAAASGKAILASDGRIAVVPLICRGETLGVLVAEGGGDRGFALDDLRLLAILAWHGGMLLHGAGLYRDATEARRLLEARTAELEERTRELEERTREVEKLAAEKDRILGMVAHDVRSPLTAILLNAEVLRQPGVGHDEVIGGLATIERIVGRVNRLIEDLIDYSLASAGRIRLEPRPVAVRSFLRECLEQHRLQAEGRGIALDLRVPAVERSIFVDPARTEQVVANLLDNAVKYCPAGCCVALTASYSDEGGVTIGVEDDGPGMDEETAARFLAGGEPRKGVKARGHGLGMAIARRMIELQGLALRLDTSPGRGTAISFTCPSPPARPGGEAAPGARPPLLCASLPAA